MYRKILVPLDGSRRAEAILRHVRQLATLFGSEVIFVQVFQIPHMVDLPRLEEDAYESLPKRSREEMEAQVEVAQRYLREQVAAMAADGISARERIEYGPIASTIMNAATDEEVDLIAMASHGCSGLEGVFYGSVAEGVLHRVDRPLLIVRASDEGSDRCD